jgi:hypothetical protein
MDGFEGWLDHGQNLAIIFVHIDIANFLIWLDTYPENP